MIYLTQKGIKFINEVTMTRGEQRQRIALKHLELRKDPKRAKAVEALKDKYRQLESVGGFVASWAGGKVLDWGAKKVKALITKAKGHDLPRVRPSGKMSAKEEKEAYERFKTTAGGGKA